MDFAIRAHGQGGRAVVAVAGDLDVITAPRLRDRLIEEIDGGAGTVFVDLTGCGFVDSAGLSALVSAWKRARGRGGDLRLVCPAGNVRRMIELTALDQVISIYDDPEALPA